MKQIKLLRNVTIMLLIFGLTACSDSAGVDPGEPPAVPQIGQALKIDASYFNANSGQKMVQRAQNNFSAAAAVVVANIGLLAFGEINSGLLSLAEGKDASYSNGMWIWEYNYSAEGQSVTIKLTAEKNTAEGTVDWALYISSSEAGFENYKFMEGTVSTDGLSGSWSIFAFDPSASSEAVFVFDWAVLAEDNKTLTLTFNFEDDKGRLSYTRDGSIYELTVSPANADYTAVVHWNTDTMTGYYIGPEGVKSCWNSDFQDVPCGEGG